MLRRNCLLEHVMEGKIEGRKKLREDKEEDVRMLETGKRSTRLPSVEDLF